MIRQVCLLTVSLVTVFSTDNGAFQVAPKGTLLAPVNTSVQLNCSLHQGYKIAWLVDGEDIRDFRDLFRDRGIEELMHSETNSSLIINGTSEENDITMVQCVAISTQIIDTVESEVVEVIFYGPPPSPANLSVDTSDQNSLNISWSLTFIEGVEVSFELRITNPTDSTMMEGPIAVRLEHYVFTPDRDDPCAFDQYSIQVTAINLAGNSPPAETTVSLFPLRDIFPALDSLQVSLEKTQSSGIVLNVTFENDTTCPEYPTTEYTLVLEDSVTTNNITLHQPKTSGDVITFIIENLIEDTIYIILVRATNQFGSSSGFEMTLMTTDVQDVIVACQDESTISITCTYLSGSDASGCVYTLVSMSGEDNQTDTIARGDIEEVAVEQAPYRELIVYDWENDTTIGSVPIRREVSSTIASCFSTTDFSANTTARSTTGSRNLVVLIISVTVVVIVFLLVVMVILVVLRVQAYRTGEEAMHVKKGGESESQPKLSIEVAAENEPVEEADDREADPDEKQQDIEALYSSISKPVFKTKASSEVMAPPAVVPSDTPDKAPGGEEDTGPMYSTLSEQTRKTGPDDKVTSPPVVPSEEDAEHSQLNQGHIYQVLENTKESSPVAL